MISPAQEEAPDNWRRRDRILSVFLMLFALVMWILVEMRVSSSAAAGELSAAFFPKLFTLVVGGMSALLGATTFMEQSPGQALKAGPGGFPWVVLLVVALSYFYTYATEAIGFIPSTIIFLITIMLTMNERRWLHMILTAVLTPVTMMLVFEYLMKILFPRGYLFQ